MFRCLLLDAFADCVEDVDDDDDDELELQAASMSAAAARAAPRRQGRGRKVMGGTARLLDGWSWSGTEPGPARVAGRLRLQTLPRPGPAIGMTAGEQDVSGSLPVGEAGQHVDGGLE